MTLGVGLTLATIVMFFRDVQHFWGVFTTLLMWGSALFYPVSVVPEKYQFIFDYNPLFQVIDMIRRSVIYGQAYDPFQVFFMFLELLYFS